MIKEEPIIISTLDTFNPMEEEEKEFISSQTQSDQKVKIITKQQLPKSSQIDQ